MDNDDSTEMPTADATTSRRFIPYPSNAKPSDLFPRTSRKTALTDQAGFFSEGNDRCLIYVSGRRDDRGSGTSDAVYAIVWGPDSHELDKLPREKDLQTGEHAEMWAVMKALNKLVTWYGKPPPSEVVFAYSGNWGLSQVPRSSPEAETVNRNKKPNLKAELETTVWMLEGRGTMVKFWVLDREDNKAGEMTLERVYGKEGLVQWLARKAVTVVGYL